MARLILSNLCLSFNILLLNTLLRKPPSTLISSRDLIKLVCSVSGIAKPFEPYFVCLLCIALKYCVCESALGSHAFYFEGSETSFQGMCFLLSVRHLFAQAWSLSLCLALDFPVLTQQTVNTVLGGGSCTSHIVSILSHPVSHRCVKMHGKGTPFSFLSLERVTPSCSHPIHQEVAWRTTLFCSGLCIWELLDLRRKVEEMKSQPRKCYFKTPMLVPIWQLWGPRIQQQFGSGHIWTDDSSWQAQEILSNKSQLLRYLRINLVYSKTSFFFTVEVLNFQSSTNACYDESGMQFYHFRARNLKNQRALFIYFRSRSIGYISRYLHHTV